MKQALRIFAFTALLVVSGMAVAVAANPAAMETRHVEEMPVITLKAWQDSTPHERNAFIFGFVSLLEQESRWQRKPLPVKKSLIGSWHMGLKDATMSDIVRAVDDYIAKNPQDAHKNVIEVLWTLYVHPKLTEGMIKDIRARYNEIEESK